MSSGLSWDPTDAARRSLAQFVRQVAARARHFRPLLQPRQPIRETNWNIQRAKNMESTSQKCIVNILPNETLLHILREVCGDRVPSRRLALVCRHWRALLLECSNLWSEISISMVSELQLSTVDRVRRHLELSKHALLDVTLEVIDWDSVGMKAVPSSFMLFDILCDVEVSRWRSLHLRSNPIIAKASFSDTIWTRLNNLKGSLTSLEVLRFEDPEALPTYGRLYDLLLERPGTLRELRIVTSVPTPLSNPRFLRGIVKLVASDNNWLFPNAASRQSFLQPWSREEQTRLPLPSEVVLISVYKPRLQLLDFSAVRSLEVSDGWNRKLQPLSFAIHLSLLSKLTLESTLSDVKWLKAPLLTALEVKDWGHAEKSWREEATRIFNLFKDEPEEITMDILSLTIGIPIPYRALLKVVTHWSRLQHLAIDISRNKMLSWNGSFAKDLIKPKQLICPMLKTLTLTTRWETEDSDKWRATVETMFQQRTPAGALQKVGWTHGDRGQYTSVRLPNERFTLPLNDVAKEGEDKG